MTPGDLASWSALGVALLALTGTVVTLLSRRRQVDADADNLLAMANVAITDATLKLTPELTKRITALEGQLTEQGKRLTIQSQRITDLEHDLGIRTIEVEGLRAGVAVLTNQLKRLEITPEYNPPAQTAQTTRPGTGPLTKGA